MKSNVTRCVSTEAAVVERKTEGAHINDNHIINSAYQRYVQLCINNSAFNDMSVHTSAHQ